MLSDESCCRAGMNLFARQSCWCFAAAYLPSKVNSPSGESHPNLQRLEFPPVWRNCMLWTIFAILLLLWLLGWGFHIAGGLIHLILVIALIVMVIELITGRRAAV